MSDPPTIAYPDAAEMCQAPYDSRAEALAAARRLDAAGYQVVEHTDPRPDGAVVVASVYLPDTGDSPGDVAYRTRKGHPPP